MRRAAPTVVVVAGLALVHGCASRDQALRRTPAPTHAPTPEARRFRVTSPALVSCPAQRRGLPMSLADLDDDGRRDRVSVTRAEGGFTVHVHNAPSLLEKQALFVPGDSVEVAVTRTARRTAGDLWLYVGHMEPAASGVRWSHTLERLARDRFVTVASDGGGYPAPNLRLDLDGDGHVDPIVTGNLGVSAILDGVPTPIPGVHYGPGIHGIPAAFGLEEPVDLDGDGQPDLLSFEEGEAKIVRLPSFSVSFVRTAAAAAIVRFGGAPAIFVRDDTGAEILAADATHRSLARLNGLPYTTAMPRLDPAGDGSVLAINVLGSSALLSAHAPPSSVLAGSAPFRLDVELAASGDPDLATLGPVRLAPEGPRSLVGVRTLNRGSIAAFDSDGAAYELLVRDPPGLGRGRVIGRGRLSGEGGASAQLVDLDGDGVFEILLTESDAWISSDLSDGGGGRSRLFLLRGDGHVLWADQVRSHTFGNHRSHDARAQAHALDLLGDGTLALQVRTEDREWYVLPAGAKLPEPLPPCLE